MTEQMKAAAMRLRGTVLPFPKVGETRAARALAKLGLLTLAIGAGLSQGSASEPGGGGGGDGTELYEVGRVLAVLEIPAPDQQFFFLRGTLPIPRQVFPMENGQVPFAVTNGAGDEVPAQVEIVSRYAKESDGADVVELLARVQRPPGVDPGHRIRYEVIWSPHDRDVIAPGSQVASLIETPFAVKLRTHDVFGHEYVADPLRDLRNNSPDLRTLRNGRAAHQVRTHEVLLPTAPVPGPQGTLPHGLGVHAFVTVWDEARYLSLDLRIHNGSDGNEPASTRDDPLGDVYFRELELVLPMGWHVVRAFNDPMTGSHSTQGEHEVWPLVSPMPDGSMHLMPQQAQFHRRLVIAREEVVDAAKALVRESWLGFSTPGHSDAGNVLFSWSNPDTARYFPQKSALPELWHEGEDFHRQWLRGRFEIYNDVLSSGASEPWPINVPNLGWAHPWGLSIGYAHGGDEIFLHDGIRTAYSRSTPGYRMFQLTHRMMTERHPTALFDNDGEAFTLEDWIVDGPNGPYVPVYIWTQPVLWLLDPFGFTNSPDFQRQAVVQQGLVPDYAGSLRNYEAIDRAHLIRYTRSPKVLAWLGNDALSKDDLRMQAELQRVGYTSLPQNYNGDHIVTGLRADQLQVQANPAQGVAVNRGEGWAIDLMAAAYSLAGPSWRQRVRPWFYDLAELVEDATSDCTGMLTSDPNLDQFDGVYRSRQSISAAIIQNALWGVRNSVFGRNDIDAFNQLSDNLRSDIYGMISELVWNEDYNAPWFYVALGPYNPSLPEFCSPPPPDGFQEIDAYQVWASFAYGHELSLDPAFLQHAALTLGQPLSTPNLTSDNHGLIENRAALMALVQKLLE